jgi:hypothetical protein
LQRQETGTILFANVPVIEISASSYLVDPNIPFRYGLQNAFDGDPATSYVENTEDDFIEIEFSGIYRYGYINKIAIINGYALNATLYNNNNRIKKIKFNEQLLKDYDLSHRILDAPQAQWVIVEDIYKGGIYNDTCIAELNAKTEHGWLFGDRNE